MTNTSQQSLLGLEVTIPIEVYSTIPKKTIREFYEQFQEPSNLYHPNWKRTIENEPDKELLKKTVIDLLEKQFEHFGLDKHFGGYSIYPSGVDKPNNLESFLSYGSDVEWFKDDLENVLSELEDFDHDDWDSDMEQIKDWYKSLLEYWLSEEQHRYHWTIK